MEWTMQRRESDGMDYAKKGGYCLFYCGGGCKMEQWTFLGEGRLNLVGRLVGPLDKALCVFFSLARRRIKEMYKERIFL